MNILLWVLQALLAFWNITGGLYTISNFEKIRSARASGLGKSFWGVLGGFQIAFAVALVVPGLVGAMPGLIPLAAAYLAFNSLLGCVLAAKYSGFPGMLWGVIPAVLSAIVVYGRFTP